MTEIVRLDVTSIETGEVVHSVDVSGKSERAQERILMGMLMQADTERYFIAEVDALSLSPANPIEEDR